MHIVHPFLLKIIWLRIINCHQSCPVLPTTALNSSDSPTLSFQSWEDPGLEDLLDIPGSSDSFISLLHSCSCCPEDPLDIPGSSLGVPSDKGPMLSGGSLGHPGILPSCPLKQITNDIYKTVILVNILTSMMEVECIS